MIVNQSKVELELFGIDPEDQIESVIDSEAITLFFSMLSENFYSDPVGSIIREITSNAIDANVENGSDEPIVITFQKNFENDNYELSFKDNGKGLSPETIDKIYRKFLKSTKKGKADQIGYYGLGSKTPFAYKRMSGEKYFYITTVCEDGMCYEYIYSFSNDIPVLTLLNSYATVESTGTIIKLDIDEKDYNLVINKLTTQTAYFSNVFVNNEHYNNDFMIFDKGSYVIKDKNHYSDTLHLIYGEVPYPINFDIIGNDLAYKLPIGIKVGINEVQPVPNRENIIYSNETIELIRERITNVVQEIRNEYVEQVLNNASLVERLRINNNAPFLKVKSDSSTYIFNISRLFKNGDVEPIIYLPNSKVLKFKPITGMHLIDYNLYFIEYQKIKIGRRVIRIPKSSLRGQFVINNSNAKSNYSKIEQHESFDLMNDRLNDTLENRYSRIIQKRKNHYRRYISEFAWEYSRIESQKVSLSLVENKYRNLLMDAQESREPSEKVKRKFYKKAYVEMRKHVESLHPKEFIMLGRAKEIRNYQIQSALIVDELVGDARYKKLSDEEVERELHQFKIDNNLIVQSQKRDKTVIFFRELIQRSSNYAVYLNDSKSKEQIDVLLDKYGLIFYFYKDELDKAKNYKTLLSTLKWKDKVLFIMINDTNLKLIKKIPNFYDVNEFFNISLFRKHFNDLSYKVAIHNKFKRLAYGAKRLLNRVSPYYAQQHDDIINYAGNINNSINTAYADNSLAIKMYIKKYPVSVDRYYDIRSKLKEFAKVRSKFDVFNYLEYNIPDEYLIQITKNFKHFKTKQ